MTATASKGIYLVFMTFAIALMGCLCSTQASVKDAITRPSKKEFVERLEDKTVALTAINSEGNMAAYCSGVWIGTNKILTAAHCVESSDVTLYMIKNDVGKDIARLSIKVKIDQKSDLALLVTDPENTPPHRIAAISRDKPYAGLKVFIEGHTTGMWWTFSEGVVSSSIRTFFEVGRTPSIQISAPAWFGNSGGGAFNDDGDLVGICSWLSVRGPNLTFFVPNDTLKEFVKVD